MNVNNGLAFARSSVTHSTKFRLFPLESRVKTAASSKSCLPPFKCKYQSTLSTSTAPNSTTDSSPDADAAFGFTPQELENAKPFHEIPSPPSVPFFGNLFSFKPFTNVNALDRKQSCRVFEDRFGPIFRLSLPFIPAFKDVVEIIDPADFEIIFRNEGKYPTRPAHPAHTAYRRKRQQTLGLLNTNQEAWWKLRQPLNKTMMRANAALPYLEAQNPVGDELVNVMKKQIQMNDGKFPHIMSAFNKWAFESVCTIVFDQRLGCLDPTLPADSWQSKFISSVLACMEDGVSLTINPVHKIYNKFGKQSPKEKRFEANMDFITEKSIEMVEDCRRRYEADADADLSKKFLPQLLSLNLSVDQTMSIIFDMMIAAIDTTTYALTNNAYFLAKNPEVQEKLYQEVVTHCGTISAPRDLTPSTLTRMRYLKAVMKETFRLKPIIPLNMRAPVRDIVVKGYRIPKGTMCLIEQDYASTNEKYFSNPLMFQPQRWLREDDKAGLGRKRDNPFLVLPFGFGPRMCIGRRFAEQEIFIGLITLVRAFHFDYHGELPLKGVGVDKLPIKLHFMIKER